MKQEIFDFGNTERLSWKDFIESKENQEALRYLMTWPNWSNNVLILFGESGVGKSHLAGLWAQCANAIYITQGDLCDNPRELFLTQNSFVIEQFDDLVFNAASNNWMFHFLNILREKQGYLLVTERVRPTSLNIWLNDLRSRILSYPAVHIESPKDELLFNIAKKVSKDLGVFIPDEALSYMLNIIDRNVITLATTLKTLDKLSLQLKKKISLSFVRKYLRGVE